MPTSNSTAASHAAALLRDKGWTLRAAAPLLGVHFGHLHHVVTGTRTSSRLIAAIEALPSRKAPATRPRRAATHSASRRKS